jgi:transposase-like protein
MKPHEREEARRLRREQGLSVKEITRLLGAAKSSVSTWVRDIELTTEQREAMKARHPFHFGQHQGAKTNQTRAREQRRQYQEQGRQKAKERDPLHIAGCMLYWAEGTKSKNQLTITNSDVDLMKFYLKFLTDSLHLPTEKMGIYINCYLTNNLTLDEITNYWLHMLELPQSCLRRPTVNAQPTSSQQKGRKLYYGVCKLVVHDTQAAQHVLGAIQEYAGIEKPEWLF